MGGRWRHKLLVSLYKLYKVCTTKIHNLWVDIGVTSLYSVSIQYTKLSLQRCTIYGWTLALQTYSVLIKYTKFAKQRYTHYGWTLALQTSSVSIKYAKRIHYKDTQIMGGRWRYKVIMTRLAYAKFTLQRYTNYGRTLALQT